ncbi:unnamed protein product [Heterosigma akashiwo]
MDERLSDNPSERKFIVTFSKPHIQQPVPTAVAHVYLSVLVLDTKFLVMSYQVEGRREILDPETPFNERWIDEVIRRKTALRGLVDVSDDFTRTRITEESNGEGS